MHVCETHTERDVIVSCQKPNRMPLTLNTGTARPREGVQPGKEGARLPQHARTTAGDIIELTGTDSQSFHAVEHGTPSHPQHQSVQMLNSLCAAVMPLLTSLTKAVITTQQSNSYQLPFTDLSLAVTPSAVLFLQTQSSPPLSPSQLECRSGSCLAWAKLSVTLCLSVRLSWVSCSLTAVTDLNNRTASLTLLLAEPQTQRSEPTA